MRNENVSKENISTKQILQERESVKNISKENRIEFSGKLQKSVLEVQRKYGDILGFPHHVSETHPADADSRSGGSVYTICGPERI